MKMTVATTSAVCLGLLLHAGVETAAAQTYPVKPVRLVLPFPTGGPVDTIARIVTPRVGDGLGQRIVIESRPGANGNIGADHVAKSAPDGYTMMMVVSSFVTNPALYQTLPFDPLRDFAPVTLMLSTPLVMVAHPSLPVRSVKDLIALAKAKPGALNYGVAGNGAGGHLALELFKIMAGVNIVAVVYKGGGQAITDAMGGQIHLTGNNPLVIFPHVKSGRLRPLAVTGAQRLQVAPNIPTVEEAGLPGFEATLWYGIVVPAATPPAIINRLNGEFVKSVQHPETQERMTNDGARVIGSTPEQFGEHMKREAVKWTKVIRTAGIRLD